MSKVLPKIRVGRGNIGNDIWIDIPDLSSFEKTWLSADEAAAQTALSVLSGVNFSVDQYVLIGFPGAERSEIRKISAKDANSITVSSALDFAHPQGTLITFLPFNQIELYSASAVGGSYSLASTIDIRADALQTYINRPSDASTVAYKVRFKNSNDTTYSDYSDEVIGAGYEDNTVFAIKSRALSQLDEKIEGIITDKFLNECLWEARREVDRERKKWSWRTAFNTDIGNIVAGQYSVATPTTLRDPDTNQNILGLRIGSQGRNLTYIDKRSFDMWYEGIVKTTVATQPSVGATSLVVADCRDLEDSGSVVIGTNTITYTAKDNATATLSGIPASGTGSIDAAHAVGLNVWQNASFGEPTLFTVFENAIYFNVPFSDDFSGNNIIMDFYRTLPAYDSDSDVVDEPDYDMLVSYLKYKIKDLKKKGTVSKDKDPDYTDYTRRKAIMLKNEITGQGVQFVPGNEHLRDAE